MFVLATWQRIMKLAISSHYWQDRVKALPILHIQASRHGDESMISHAHGSNAWSAARLIRF